MCFHLLHCNNPTSVFIHHSIVFVVESVGLHSRFLDMADLWMSLEGASGLVQPHIAGVEDIGLFVKVQEQRLGQTTVTTRTVHGPLANVHLDGHDKVPE